MPTFRLVETNRRGGVIADEFDAPDDEAALERVLDVVAEAAFELWCGDRLVRRDGRLRTDWGAGGGFAANRGG